MSCVVMRSRKKETKGILPLKLSDEACRRAREHLKSAGIDVERLPPLIWPEDAVSAYRKHMYEPWQFTTKADILRKRRERMEKALRGKREYDVVHRRALYVWVFRCPGINNFIFRGWWTYLIGLTGQYHGGGYKGEVTGGLFNQIRELFPVENPHPLYALDADEWMQLFAKQYQRGKWCGKPQGKAPIWAEVKDGSIERILSRADWPKNNHWI